MKFNWGTGILITIVIFFMAVVGIFIYSANLDINLVEENYYEKELAYQEKIDRIKNTEALEEEILIRLDNKILRVDFPEFFNGKKTEGHVLFYRPSDPAKDFTIPLELNDSSVQIIDASRLDPGRYMVKIDWTADGISYYFEEPIFNQ
jgi:nitrogen fixation protein FixH